MCEVFGHIQKYNPCWQWLLAVVLVALIFMVFLYGAILKWPKAAQIKEILTVRYWSFPQSLKRKRATWGLQVHPRYVKRNCCGEMWKHKKQQVHLLKEMRCRKF